ncbi:hypothetical protein HY641_00870 [Candidatus Woesearchaeota archaeon]|nr:hypothetical protein [Candidatus Woesearchaeota archaeon]
MLKHTLCEKLTYPDFSLSEVFEAWGNGGEFGPAIHHFLDWYDGSLQAAINTFKEEIGRRTDKKIGMEINRYWSSLLESLEQLGFRIKTEGAVVNQSGQVTTTQLGELIPLFENHFRDFATVLGPFFHRYGKTLSENVLDQRIDEKRDLLRRYPYFYDREKASESHIIGGSTHDRGARFGIPYEVYNVTTNENPAAGIRRIAAMGKNLTLMRAIKYIHDPEVPRVLGVFEIVERVFGSQDQVHYIRRQQEMLDAIKKSADLLDHRSDREQILPNIYMSPMDVEKGYHTRLADVSQLMSEVLNTHVEPTAESIGQWRLPTLEVLEEKCRNGCDYRLDTLQRKLKFQQDFGFREYARDRMKEIICRAAGSVRLKVPEVFCLEHVFFHVGCFSTGDKFGLEYTIDAEPGISFHV